VYQNAQREDGVFEKRKRKKMRLKGKVIILKDKSLIKFIMIVNRNFSLGKIKLGIFRLKFNLLLIKILTGQLCSFYHNLFGFLFLRTIVIKEERSEI